MNIPDHRLVSGNRDTDGCRNVVGLAVTKDLNELLTVANGKLSIEILKRKCMSRLIDVCWL